MCETELTFPPFRPRLRQRAALRASFFGVLQGYPIKLRTKCKEFVNNLERNTARASGEDRAASAYWLRYQNFFFFMIHRQISTTSTLTTMTAG